jgi:hypothetical protein
MIICRYKSKSSPILKNNRQQPVLASYNGDRFGV